VTRGRENPAPVLVIRLALEQPAQARIEASTYEDCSRLQANLARRDLRAEVERALGELLEGNALDGGGA
jgi:hypothetical protein